MLAVNQALRAPDRLGPCGQGLVYACTMLDRFNEGWRAKNKTLSGWWEWAQPVIPAYRAKAFEGLDGVNWGWSG